MKSSSHTKENYTGQLDKLQWSGLDFDQLQRNPKNKEDIAYDSCQKHLTGTVVLPSGVDLCALFNDQLSSDHTHNIPAELAQRVIRRTSYTARVWGSVAASYELAISGSKLTIVQRLVWLWMSGKMPVHELPACNCFQELCGVMGIGFPPGTGKKPHMQIFKPPKPQWKKLPQRKQGASSNDDWQPTKNLEGKTLAPPKHSVYREGYWVDADDIIFIMSALLGDIGMYAPTAFNLVAGALEKAVSKKRAPSKTARSFDTRWGKWTIQVTTCGDSGSSGSHWVLTATKFVKPHKR